MEEGHQHNVEKNYIITSSSPLPPSKLLITLTAAPGDLHQFESGVC